MGYSDIKELLKDAKDIATGANDLQLKSLLLDIQDKVFELQEENKNLRDQINEMENDRITEASLVYKNNAYYKLNDDEKAHCLRCFDADKKLITLTKQIPALSTTYQFKCPNCNNKFDSGINHNQDTSITF